jgi:predicted metal-dependent phosphoesterase TrpH
MNVFLKIFGLLFFILINIFVFPQKRYYKGNTHTHCYPYSGDITDTSYSGDKVVSQYKARGYDFLVFTDHGAWWNAKVLSTPDFTVINGSECGISGSGRWGHFTGLKLLKRISGVNLSHQQMIDSINAQGGISFINHPRYSQIPITAKQIINEMRNNLFHQEIWNGVTVGQPPPDDITVWDSVLSTGRIIYGVASDDSHKESNQGKGWIMVYASSNNEDTLVNEIRKGNFYSTTGIIIDSIYYSPSSIFIRSSNGETIRFIGKNGSTLKTVIGTEGSYSINGDEIYVRAEISNSTGKRGWIQPMMITVSSINEEDESLLIDYRLYQNFPNPFNPLTMIEFELMEKSNIRLSALNILGKEIRILLNEEREAGSYSIDFNASNLPSGVYFYRLQSGNFINTKKMLLLK